MSLTAFLHQQQDAFLHQQQMAEAMQRQTNLAPPALGQLQKKQKYKNPLLKGGDNVKRNPPKRECANCGHGDGTNMGECWIPTGTPIPFSKTPTWGMWCNYWIPIKLQNKPSKIKAEKWILSCALCKWDDPTSDLCDKRNANRDYCYKDTHKNWLELPKKQMTQLGECGPDYKYFELKELKPGEIIKLGPEKTTTVSTKVYVDKDSWTRKVWHKFTNNQEPREDRQMGIIKTYFEKHQETLMTLGIIILVDHFFLNGTLRDKIQKMVEGILNRQAEKVGMTGGNSDPKDAA